MSEPRATTGLFTKECVYAPNFNRRRRFEGEDEVEAEVLRRIIRARRQAGLGLQEAADRIGITRHRLTAMELGRAPVHASTLVGLARAYGRHPAAFLPVLEPPEQP